MCTSVSPCDEALFAAARCVVQEMLPKRILSELGATVSGVSVYEVADTSAGHAALGGAVQVDPMKPKLKPPDTKPLKLKCNILLSTPAFKFNLRRYSSACRCPSARPPPPPPSRRHCRSTRPTALPPMCPPRAAPAPGRGLH